MLKGFNVETIAGDYSEKTVTLEMKISSKDFESFPMGKKFRVYIRVYDLEVRKEGDGP